MSDPTPERWQKIEAVFCEAADKTEAERATWLEAACGGDASLRREVEALLRSAGSDTTFLEPPPSLAAPRPAPDAAPAAIPADARIGSCRLLRVLGEGGMGVVYEAWQETLRRTVAVKVMRSGFGTPAARQRFEWEARVLAHLRHPNIAQIFESGVHAPRPGELGTPYFVMELVADALPLDRFVREQALDDAARIDAFLPVCDAVHFGHLRGVVHRDLKFANLLVGEDGRPKVIDYGVARATGDDAASRSFQTQTGLIVGTVRTMSPEQVGGDVDDVDARSDVYALAVLLYELLVGRHPYFDGPVSLAEAASVIRDRAPERPSRVAASFPRDLETILLKGLAKRREDRYESAAALAEDLRRFRQGLPILARPPTSGYHVRLFVRRHKALVAVSAAAVLVLAAAAVVSALFALDARRARVAESARADQAERLLRSSRRFGDWVVHDLQPRLTPLAGATKLREEVVERVLAHLDALSADAAGNAEVRRSIARGYVQAGVIQGSPSHANLGHTGAALASLARARSAFVDLFGPEPAAWSDRLDLVIVDTIAADIRAGSGELEEAERGYAAVQAACEALIRERPDHPDPGEMAIHAHHGLSVVARQRGRLAEAAAHSGRAYRLREERATHAPGDAKAFHEAVAQGVAHAYDLMGAGDAAEAYDLLEALLERSEGEPGGEEAAPVEARIRIGNISAAQGRAARLLGRDDEALRRFRRSAAVYEKLVAADPDNASHLVSLGHALEGVADLGERAGEEGALERHDRHLALERKLVALAPHNREYRQKLAFALFRTGRAHLVAGDGEPGVALLEEALPLAEALHREQPAADHDQQLVSDILETHARFRQIEAQRAEGPAERDEALRLALALHARNRDFVRGLGPDDDAAAPWRAARLARIESRMAECTAAAAERPAAAPR